QQANVGGFILEINSDSAVMPRLCGCCGQCVTPRSSGLGSSCNTMRVTRCNLRQSCRAQDVTTKIDGMCIFLLQKLHCVVYCRKKTLNDRQSRRVNQQNPTLPGSRREDQHPGREGTPRR